MIDEMASEHPELIRGHMNTQFRMYVRGKTQHQFSRDFRAAKVLRISGTIRRS